MVHSASEHIGHCLNSTVRMHRKSGKIVIRVVGSKMVEQQKWIEIIQRSRSDTSLEPHSCTFYDGLGLDDFEYFLYYIIARVTAICL